MQTPTSPYSQVFQEYRETLLSAVNRGHDLTFLLLGPHGSGKSFTMVGQPITALTGDHTKIYQQKIRKAEHPMMVLIH